MRLAPLALSAVAASLAVIAQAAPVPHVIPIVINCTGPVVAQGHRIARENGLKSGQDSKACFGRMHFPGDGAAYLAVSVPSPRCPRGTALDVYGQANSGNWGSYFETPVCGSTISIGPKNQWGADMLTIDGRHYDQRGGHYVLVN